MDYKDGDGNDGELVRDIRKALPKGVEILEWKPKPEEVQPGASTDAKNGTAVL